MNDHRKQPAAKAEPFTIPHTFQRSLSSSRTEGEYRILTARPAQEAPPEGYPVIYVLDADAVFATIVEAMRVQSRRSAKTGVVPAIIVGIGYDTDEPFHPSRHYDFTMNVPRSELPPHPEGGEWPRQGGAESFMAFIEEELKLLIEKEFPIDRSRQTLVGHSLGGLFVLHSLFCQPGRYLNYVAGSPSIHWNRSALMEEEERFTPGLVQENMRGSDCWRRSESWKRGISAG